MVSQKLSCCLLILVIIIFASLISVKANESRWKLIFNDENKSLYIDTKTLVHPSKEIIRVWIKTIYKDHEYLELKEINCSQYLIKIVDCMKYSGDKVDTCPGESLRDKWMVIVPESLVETLYDAVCTKKK